MSYEDRKRTIEEGLEEWSIEIDDRKYPVERIYDVANDFKELIEELSVAADKNEAVLSEHIV